jgi:hypothetical protein
MSHEPMHKIIKLKRYEKPPEDYFENFLREFHHRQRAEMLRPSLRTIILERLSGFLAEVRVPAMAYAGATAVAIVAGVVILREAPPAATPRSYVASATSSSATPYTQTPVTIDRIQPVSLRIDTPNSPETSLAFPPAYQLQARPASHESPLSF